MPFASSFTNTASPWVANAVLFGFLPTASRFAVELTRNPRKYSIRGFVACKMRGGELENLICTGRIQEPIYYLDFKENKKRITANLDGSIVISVCGTLIKQRV